MQQAFRITKLFAVTAMVSGYLGCEAKVATAPSSAPKEIVQESGQQQPAPTKSAVPQATSVLKPEEKEKVPEPTETAQLPTEAVGAPVEGAPAPNESLDQQPGPVTTKKGMRKPGISFGSEKPGATVNGTMQLKNIQVSDTNDGKPGISKNFRLQGGVYLTK